MQIALKHRDQLGTELVTAYRIQVAVLGILAARVILFESLSVVPPWPKIIIVCSVFSTVGMLLKCGRPVLMMVWGLAIADFVVPFVTQSVFHMQVRATVYGLTICGTIGLAAGVVVDYFNASARLAKASVRDNETGKTQPPAPGDSQ